MFHASYFDTETSDTKLIDCPGYVVFRVVASPPVSEQDWMYEVLDCFDSIVLNAGNTFRLQEECAFHSSATKEKKLLVVCCVQLFVCE